jgi:hypothetical protein
LTWAALYGPCAFAAVPDGRAEADDVTSAAALVPPGRRGEVDKGEDAAADQDHGGERY